MKKRIFMQSAVFLSCIFGCCITGSSAMAEEPVVTVEDEYAYDYTGDNSVLSCICEYMVEMGEEPGDGEIAIPAPAIFAADKEDMNDVKIYGNFAMYRYTLEDGILVMQSGAEHPGVFHLVTVPQGYEVLSFDAAGDGEKFTEDIERFCEGTNAFMLRELFYGESGLEVSPEDYARTTFIEQFVYDYDLPVTAYQDYGWDPVEISPLKQVCFEDALYRDTGILSFVLRCGNMDFSITGTDETEPSENGTSNFGDCEGQYGMSKDFIDLYYGGAWHVFQKTGGEPETDGGDDPAFISVTAEFGEEQAPGTKAELTFEDNPSLGFAWTVSQETELFDISGSYESDAAGELIDGAGGRMIFTLVPAAAGTTKVTFTLGRSWEEYPIKICTYTFEVDEELRLRLTNAEVTAEDNGYAEPEIILPEISGE